MGIGKNTYQNMAVPLRGESEITQLNAANDILTITGAGSQAGDFLVARSSAGAEKAVIDKDGKLTLGGDLAVTGDASVDDLTVAGKILEGTIAARTGATEALKVVPPASQIVNLSGTGAVLDYTLAAPGAGNFPKRLVIYSSTAQAHVVTVTGLAGGDTLTFGGAIGDCCELMAVSATAWILLGVNNVVLSTAG